MRKFKKKKKKVKIINLNGYMVEILLIPENGYYVKRPILYFNITLDDISF